jgi:hypothetical protein
LVEPYGIIYMQQPTPTQLLAAVILMSKAFENWVSWCI